MASFNLFGFTIGREDKQSQLKKQSFITPIAEDGASTVSAGGYYGTFVDIDASARSESELISRYREISNYPDCDTAIEEIVVEALAAIDSEEPVRINLDDLKLSPNIKKAIEQEFNEILSLLDFKDKAHDIFRRWYVDGRLYYQKLVNTSQMKKGIQELRYIDPRKIRKVREIKKDKLDSGVEVVSTIDEFFIYNERGMNATPGVTPLQQANSGIRIQPDSITFCPSGLLDLDRNIVIGYLHKAIKPVNQLKMMADSLVIYRLSRAPERRIFYIDVGNLPKIKAEQYMKDIMNRYRNKIVYDSSTGEIKDDRKFMTMLEDFWLPRREGGRGTEITTLPGGCFSMDTKVSLLDGRELSISEIEQEIAQGKTLWTYSCDEFTGEVKPGLISWAGVTQESAQVMKLTLDNGEHIICTPDHKFPIYGKGFVEAKDFVVGEKLIPVRCNVENEDICVSSIEYLDEKIQVGTLRIDDFEQIHGHHTFALSVGVFTKNSNLGEISDVAYFQDKVYQALNVPNSRFQQSAGFNFGRAAEISRDELKFAKFISRLRRKFNVLFDDLLMTQLILKGIITAEDWPEIKEKIDYEYAQDQYYQEIKDAENLRNRLDIVNQMTPYVGIYFSKDYIRKNVLKMTPDDIEQIEKENQQDPMLQQPQEQQAAETAGPGSEQAAALSRENVK